MGLFDSFFRVEEADEDVSVALTEARDIVAFSQFSQYGRLIEWLTREIDAPIDVKSDGQTMISLLSRQNTLKEVRAKLRRDLSQASATIDRAREEHNG